MKSAKHSINRFLFIFIILCTVSTIYPKEKKYLSIEEKTRTLSNPRGTWKIDLGAEFDFGRLVDSFAFEFDRSLFNIQFPYLPIGNLTELHFFMTPMIKIYALKNVSEQDSFLVINGPNLAFMGGVTSLYYSSTDGLDLYGGVGYQFKTETGKNTWLFSNGWGNLNLKMAWSSELTVGTGSQITKNFAIIFSLKGSVYQNQHYYLETTRDKNYIEYAINFPVDFKVNWRRKSGFMLRTGFVYRANTVNNVRFWGIPVGIQYSWHW